MPIRVSAPASTANLGPGFDSLAAALSLTLEIEAEPADGKGSFTFDGPDRSPGAEGRELITRAVTAVATDAPPLNVAVSTEVPMGAGLGSSAAAVAAGLLVGCALADIEPDPGGLLQLGAAIEGHPDNLAAALYGGLTLVVPVPGGLDVLAFSPTSSVRPFILLPRERLATSEARRALPDEVLLADAVANGSRATGLVSLLTGVVSPTTDRLWTYTQDVLHQPYRAQLMPHTAEVLESLRSSGIPAALSGAGPAILCLVVRGDETGPKEVCEHLEGWELMELDWSADGARIVES